MEDVCFKISKGTENRCLSLPQEAYNRYTHSDNYNIQPYLLFVKREISSKLENKNDYIHEGL